MHYLICYAILISMVTHIFNSDEKLMNVLFLTYRSFLTPQDFLDNLILCFFSKLHQDAIQEDVALFEKVKVQVQLK
jgi:hypothetical protein